jgi:hypothetical protein
LCASYHLNKETGEKSGDLIHVKVEDEKIVKEASVSLFDFGVLSIEPEADGKFSMGCSDGAVRLADTVYQNEGSQGKCALHHASSDDRVISAMSSGELHIYDKKSAEHLHTLACH